jgi:hypothetical protein
MGCERLVAEPVNGPGRKSGGDRVRGPLLVVIQATGADQVFHGCGRLCTFAAMRDDIA